MPSLHRKSPGSILAGDGQAGPDHSFTPIDPEGSSICTPACLWYIQSISAIIQPIHVPRHVPHVACHVIVSSSVSTLVVTVSWVLPDGTADA
jgi:hypothetical protein